jgi:hypothetical protein
MSVETRNEYGFSVLIPNFWLSADRILLKTGANRSWINMTIIGMLIATSDCTLILSVAV